MSLFVKRGSGTIIPPRIACFVCGAEGPADYPIYAEPQSPLPNVTPHFPFLAVHPPPLGLQPVNVAATGGEAKACRPCYTVLMRQWDEFEHVRVPLHARSYWVKRVDGVPFLSPDVQMQATLQLQQGRSPAATTAAAATLSSISTVIGPLHAGVMPAPAAAKVTVGITTASNSPQAHNWPPSRPMAVDPPVVSSASGDNDSALDLSSGSRDRETESRSSVASHQSVVSLVSCYNNSEPGSSTDILDLTLPDKNATFEVCYACGDEFKRGSLSYSFAKQMSNQPFYPTLICHPRPPKSRPMDSSGRVQTCDECHEYLLQQWYKFEMDSVPHADRNYILRKRLTQSIDTATFVCYICALDYHSSALRLLYSRPNTEGEPYYPFIEQQKPAPGASPISPQGMVQVCTLCYKSTKEKHHGFMKADQPPPKKRRSLIPTDASDLPTDTIGAAHNDDEDRGIPADVTCLLCRRKFSVSAFKLLHTRGPPLGGLPYFPFLSDLPCAEEPVDSNDEQARVRACQACATSLINQWTAFQREQVAIESRQYTYPCLLTGPRSVSSVRAHSPASQVSGGGTITPGKQVDTAATRARSNTVESRPRSASNPHSPNPYSGSRPSTAAPLTTVMPQPSPQPVPPSSTPSAMPSSTTQPTPSSSSSTPALPPPTSHSPHPGPPPPSQDGGPGAAATPAAGSASSASAAAPGSAASSASALASTSSFYCFLCGLHSELSFSRMLYSTAPGKKAPYFPFMKTHMPKNRAETLREDGTALVCTFCYHSVMVQWTRYNDAKSPVVDPAQRTYNLHDYNCYVCGILTYRKRIRALRVLDFPFLRHHKTRKNVISMENGEMVAVCLDCYDSLRGQFNEGERYGIPVEKRQYNWMMIPPPDEGTPHITTPQERLLKVEQVPVS